KGSRPVNPVGVRLHAAVHRAYPAVTAVCHAHSIHGSAWSAFGRPIEPITQDTAVFFDDQAIIREPRVASDSEGADQFAAGFAGKRWGKAAGAFYCTHYCTHYCTYNNRRYSRWHAAS
ncbi:class II aldolase/adducin family protein, partial [Pseudomonadales bacterium]|nr:class II aldolase/adducin family protein [Pseudomonadales bacterium]